MTMALTQITTGGVDENINIDSNTLKVDGTNNRVGIGTSSPVAGLTVAKQGTVLSGTSNSFGFSINPQSNGYVYLDAVTGGSNNTSLSLRTYNNGTYTQAIQSISGNDTTFETAGTERMRIDSSGNVGINNSSPSSYNSDGRNLVVGSGSGSQGLTIASGTSGYGNIYFADGTSGDALYSGMLSYYHADNHMQFRTASTERMRIDSSGKLLVGTSTSNGSAGSKLEVAKQTMTTSDMGLASFQLVSSSSRWPQVFIEKSRGSAVGDKNLVSNGDSLGELAFRGSDGTNYLTGASIIATVNGTTGTNDLPTDLRFSTTADGASSPTERMRIDSSGNVGIGTDNPGQQLTIKKTGGQTQVSLISDTNESGAIYFGDTASTNRGVVLYDHGQDSLQFSTAGSERARITSDGNFLVGTTATNPHTDGSGISITTGSGLLIGVSNTHAMIAARYTGDGELIRMQRANNDVGSIDVTSSGTTYNTTSDYRLKENVVDTIDGITRLKQLAPKRFNFTVDADVTVDGFIAHEAQAVVPEAVTGTHNGMKTDEDGNEVPDYQGLDYGKLTPLLTAALQEAIAKIETLETKVAALEAG